MTKYFCKSNLKAFADDKNKCHRKIRNLLREGNKTLWQKEKSQHFSFSHNAFESLLFMVAKIRDSLE